MALFSFRHSVKSFSTKVNGAERAAQQGQTLAHLRYISRPSAARVVERARVSPNDAETAQAAEAEAIRKKGRVAERFIVALPVEATAEQRAALARAFAERLTGGKAGYVFAIHDQNGNDLRNPHFHLVAFDAYERGGGRGRPRSVLGMARKGAVEKAAKLWADTHNDLMAGWGYGEASRISHLSHAARGIDQIPTIHEGPGARACAAKGIAPTPKPEWRRTDSGHSRAEANILIKEINQLKEMNDVQRPQRTGLGKRDDAHP
ncbi:MAG: MobA/MobL family protein, partial [Parvularcula sp.]|nr:MobA/MobL family protein [Parvularcula sp.]